MSSQPVILLEFNELCPSLLDRWIDSGELPNFNRLRNKSTICVTETDELTEPNLEPWIQWYSLHTGIPFNEHGVFRLSEGPSRPYASIWDVLLDSGRRVINFSSMNCRGFKHAGSVFLPDPWNDSEPAFPPDIEPFRAFLTKSIQEQSNAQWETRDMIAVVRYLLRHGLSLNTVITSVGQIIRESISSLPIKWQRVQVLDRILLDVFLHYYERQRPEFATFFSNSTAHLQHAYWRYLEPERFGEPVLDSDMRAYADAVKFGYQSMDFLLGRVLRIAKKTDAIIMFATALSQQAYLNYEGRGGRHYYRPTNVRELLSSIDVIVRELHPVMAHQFILTFDSEQKCLEAKRRIKAVRVGDKQLFDVANGDVNNKLIFGAQIYSRLDATQTIEFVRNGENVYEPFFSHFYELEATKSGGHHPDGCFWFQSETHRRHDGKVSILDIAPTILGHFGLIAASMTGRDLIK